MIDYKLVAKAIGMYETVGFKYVETPWLVGEGAIKATLPPDRHGFTLSNPVREPRHHHLVGSAEQAFLQMMLNGALQPGSYQSAGPCFRDEPAVDDLHQYSFFKLELVHYGREDIDVEAMAREAGYVLYDLFSLRDFPKRVKTEAGWDLEIGGVEVGSFGTRRHEGHVWTYGTGLALPRAPFAVGRL